MPEDLFGLRRLEGDIGCSGGVRLPAYCRFTEVDASGALELGSGASEGHPDGQMDEFFQEPGREAPRQEH
jgi:hypothetical protein